jgi:hypothetical protein
MDKISKHLINIMLATIVILLVGIMLQLADNSNIYSIAENCEKIAENTQTIECGACGAHVVEYTYTQNIHTGKLVKICLRCAENVEQNETEQLG